MKVYTLYRQQHLPVGIEEAWAFFSDAKNLEQITPPDMGFEVLSKLEDAPIFTGMTIDYTVRPMLGIPLRWTTLIKDVQAPYRFTDAQVRGPYSLWEHTHRFTAVPDGVNMIDEVKYSLPLGWIGKVMHALVVKRKLEKIFDFRAAVLRRLPGTKENS